MTRVGMMTETSWEVDGEADGMNLEDQMSQWNKMMFRLYIYVYSWSCVCMLLYCRRACACQSTRKSGCARVPSTWTFTSKSSGCTTSTSLMRRTTETTFPTTRCTYWLYFSINSYLVLLGPSSSILCGEYRFIYLFKHFTVYIEHGRKNGNSKWLWTDSTVRDMLLKTG